MVIAIMSEGPDTDSSAAEKFGRAPFLILYNRDENTFESLRNPYVNVYGGAGIQTSQLIIENNVNYVITTEIGINALRFLNCGGIEVYGCTKRQIKEIVKGFNEEKLQVIKQSSLQSFERKRKRRKRRYGRNNL